MLSLNLFFTQPAQQPGQGCCAFDFGFAVAFAAEQALHATNNTLGLSQHKYLVLPTIIK